MAWLGCVGFAWRSAEHYLAGSAIRFARRWWGSESLNVLLFTVGVGGVVGARFVPLVGLLVVIVAAVGPLGLGLRGRTSRLVWTGRLRRLAAASGFCAAIVVAVCALLGGLRPAMLAALALGLVMPAAIDVALLLTRALEERLASSFVDRAKGVLDRVQPRIVAITGSYGKTSTKGYVAHLLAGRFQVVASPRSFNNRAGLARTVNELLVPGTDVLVAEMGTYGRGEIAAMVAWLPPEVAVMTAIGPVHLERFKRLEVTLAAKREILVGARVVVLNVDDPLLSGLAAELVGGAQQLFRCSALDASADIALLASGTTYELFIRAERIGVVDLGAGRSAVAPTNLACAIAVAIGLGVQPSELLGVLGSLPIADNRLTTTTGPSGALILDDTFNSNPAGARLALKALVEHSQPDRRRVVVTPGMIELGRSQAVENESFAAEAGGIATDLVIVGRTNRRALRSRGAAWPREGGRGRGSSWRRRIRTRPAVYGRRRPLRERPSGPLRMSRSYSISG